MTLVVSKQRPVKSLDTLTINFMSFSRLVALQCLTEGINATYEHTLDYAGNNLSAKQLKHILYLNSLKIALLSLNAYSVI